MWPAHCYFSLLIRGRATRRDATQRDATGRAGGSCDASRPAAGALAASPHASHRPPSRRAHAPAGRRLSSPPRRATTARAYDNPRRLKRSTQSHPVTERATSLSRQNSFSSGNAVEPIRRPGGRRAGGGPARAAARPGVEHAELRREHSVVERVDEPAGLRAAARRQGEEVAEHDGVRPGAVLGARRRDRRPPRLQDQSVESEDQHVHQDAGARRGAGVRGDRPQGGRRARQEGDPLRGGALLADPRLAQVRGRASAARRRARPRDRAGARALPRRRARRRPQGRHHQAHPAHHAHLHRHAVPRARARLRGDRLTRERGGGAQGDRGAHRAAHRRRGRRARRARRRRAAGAAVPRRHRVAAAARAGGGLLVRRVVLVGRVVGAARRPARHLVVDGARRGPGRVAVVRVAGRRGGRVGLGAGAAVARGVAGARVRRVRRARRGGGAGAVRPQPVLPGVRAAAGGGRRALPRLLGARAPGHPHHLVRRPRPRTASSLDALLVGIGLFYSNRYKNIKRIKIA